MRFSMLKVLLVYPVMITILLPLTRWHVRQFVCKMRLLQLTVLVKNALTLQKLIPQVTPVLHQIAHKVILFHMKDLALNVCLVPEIETVKRIVIVASHIKQKLLMEEVVNKSYAMISTNWLSMMEAVLMHNQLAKVVLSKMPLASHLRQTFCLNWNLHLK